jgi:hypothetical protein
VCVYIYIHILYIQGYQRVKSIAYSPDKDPTRMVMEYPTVDPRDMRPLPPKRTEVCHIYIYICVCVCVCVGVCVCVCVYAYIYMHIHMHNGLSYHGPT